MRANGLIVLHTMALIYTVLPTWPVVLGKIQCCGCGTIQFMRKINAKLFCYFINHSTAKEPQPTILLITVQQAVVSECTANPEDGVTLTTHTQLLYWSELLLPC